MYLETNDRISRRPLAVSIGEVGSDAESVVACFYVPIRKTNLLLTSIPDFGITQSKVSNLINKRRVKAMKRRTLGEAGAPRRTTPVAGTIF